MTHSCTCVKTFNGAETTQLSLLHGLMDQHEITSCTYRDGIVVKRYVVAIPCRKGGYIFFALMHLILRHFAQLNDPTLT